MKKVKETVPLRIEFNGAIARSVAVLVSGLAEILTELKNLITRRLRRL
ncbi:MAG: hypothetical protein JW993_09575 [Sedimentisphaerales bacterium]|nr:hypothetical protein [Sedimentisphaerales bacterium]